MCLFVFCWHRGEAIELKGWSRRSRSSYSAQLLTAAGRCKKGLGRKRERECKLLGSYRICKMEQVFYQILCVWNLRVLHRIKKSPIFTWVDSYSSFFLIFAKNSQSSLAVVPQSGIKWEFESPWTHFRLQCVSLVLALKGEKRLLQLLSYLDLSRNLGGFSFSVKAVVVQAGAMLRIVSESGSFGSLLVTGTRPTSKLNS